MLPKSPGDMSLTLVEDGRCPLPDEDNMLALLLVAMPEGRAGGGMLVWGLAMCNACVFGVTTDGRDVMRGIFVGVAEGGGRLPSLRRDEAEEAVCRPCWLLAMGSRVPLTGNPLCIPDSDRWCMMLGWMFIDWLRDNDTLFWSPPDDSVKRRGRPPLRPIEPTLVKEGSLMRGSMADFGGSPVSISS